MTPLNYAIRPYQPLGRNIFNGTPLKYKRLASIKCEGKEKGWGRGWRIAVGKKIVKGSTSFSCLAIADGPS